MHKSVLLHEIIDGLSIKEGETFLDCTLDGAGHSAAVAEKFGSTVTIVGIDQDEEMIPKAEARLKEKNAKCFLRAENFRNLDRVLAEIGIPSVNKIFFDLGWSSIQFEESGRGFTFQKDEPLRMTYKPNPTSADITADQIINEWEEETIANILFGYGEERYARRIAKVIVEARTAKRIETTFELVSIIERAVPVGYRHGKIHPATKSFQALRIAVNDELKALEEGLRKAFEALAPEGRMAVISFHSIEDRIVKTFFKNFASEYGAKILTKKPIIAGDEEITSNPRARSAKLRILEK